MRPANRPLSPTRCGRYDETTPVTGKFLLVVVKVLKEDAFVLTTFFSKREKKGNVQWIG